MFRLLNITTFMYTTYTATIYLYQSFQHHYGSAFGHTALNWPTHALQPILDLLAVLHTQVFHGLATRQLNLRHYARKRKHLGKIFKSLFFVVIKVGIAVQWNLVYLVSSLITETDLARRYWPLSIKLMSIRLGDYLLRDIIVAHNALMLIK